MDLDNVKTEPFAREFLAVVIAGFGHELIPLTSDYGEEPTPKSLLSVANKPLLEYVLMWLEKSGIKDVLLICPTSHRSSIYHHIHSDVSSSSLRIDIQTFDETQTSNTGTCALLRHFSHRITEDFVLVPCDFIPPPSLPLTLLLDKFRLDTLSEGAIATTCWFTPLVPEKNTFPEEWGPSSATTPIVWDAFSSTLLHIDTPDDLDRNADELELKMFLLNKHPSAKMSSSFEDSHVYVCRRSILNLFHAKPDFLSIREDFFPWLCKVQSQSSKSEKYGPILNASLPTASQRLALAHSTSVSSNGIGKLEDTNDKINTSFKIGLYIHREAAGFAVRVNTVPNFYEINKRLLSNVSYTLPTDPKDRSLIDQKTQISADTMIGDSTQVSERTVIKKSVIGRHCVIGRMVKLTGCILLDHCVVEDGAKLDTCILGKNTRIGTKSELTRCVTQAGYEVNAGEILKGEKLEVSDWTTLDHDLDGDDASSASEKDS